ncbi:hypothetical protein [Pseudomonas sp. RIT357]|uniref:hypothetical protein n=1 Tax=Pseudomonas sp. RIT357 TaxID=1470593 RepID=UPI00044D0777|nr:hypothetical protein [Pseudomonas sp. RIT357]EZP62674.1 hypothetical protein BW43_05129 [Pseudomonas sp. RIT357]
MDDDERKIEEISPELTEFLSEPMTRFEVISLLQPLRSALLSTFHGSMTALGLIALHATDEEIKEKAKKTFKELDDVFEEIDTFDNRLGKLLKGDPNWPHENGDTVNE